MLNKKGFFNKFKSKKKEIIITCTLTGHGLKDPDIAIKSIKSPPTVKPHAKAVLKIIGI